MKELMRCSVSNVPAAGIRMRTASDLKSRYRYRQSTVASSLLAPQVRVCCTSPPGPWTPPHLRHREKPLRGMFSPANAVGESCSSRRPKFISRNVAEGMYSKPNGWAASVAA